MMLLLKKWWPIQVDDYRSFNLIGTISYEPTNSFQIFTVLLLHDEKMKVSKMLKNVHISTVPEL